MDVTEVDDNDGNDTIRTWAGAHLIEGECDVCPNTSWNFDICSSCTRVVCTIMDYLIQQKLIIMDVTEVDEHNALHADQLVQIPDANAYVGYWYYYLKAMTAK